MEYMNQAQRVDPKLDSCQEGVEPDREDVRVVDP
jgi:hypothetical protein